MSLIIDGHEYLSSREAAELSSYTPDYIARLCRSGEVVGKRVGKAWYVSRRSLKQFVAQAAEENQKRRSELRNERIHELQQSAVAAVHSVTAAPVTGRYALQLGKILALTAGAAVFALSFALGPTLASYIPSGSLTRAGVALVHFAESPPDVIAALADFNGRFANRIASLWIEREHVGRELSDELGDAFLATSDIISRTNLAAVVQYGVDFLNSGVQNTTQKFLVQVPWYQQIFQNFIALFSPKGSSVTTVTTTHVSHATSSTSAAGPTIIQQTIAPRNVTEHVTQNIILSGVSQAELTTRLLELENKIHATLAPVFVSPIPYSPPISSGGITNMITIMNKIDQLNGVAITGGSLTNATISGGSISNINISAGSLTGVVAISNGGSGTSTAPSYGQLLVGNSGGGYDLLATSSLGITGGGSQWTTNGNDIYYTTGNVGIGTTSPYAALSVAGASGIVAEKITATSTTATSSLPLLTTTSFAVSGQSAGCAQFGPGGQLVSIGSNCGSSSGLTSYDAWTHAFATQSATTSAIGIGTTTPFSQLAVSTSTASNPLTKLFTVASSTGAEILSVFGSGKIGIGTSSPWAQLSINSNGISGPAFAIGSSTRTYFKVSNGGIVDINPENNTDFITAGDVRFLSASSTGLNTGIGISALAAITSGSGNTALGSSAGTAITSGTANIAIGWNALPTATSTTGNIAIGNGALQDVARGYSAVLSSPTNAGSYNTGVGWSALNDVTYGAFNVALGEEAGTSNTTGHYNVALGSEALFSNFEGSGNTAVGNNAGYSALGSYNIVIGQNVNLPSNTANQQLNIGNLIYGTSVYGGSTFSSAPVVGNIGIGTSTPRFTLHIASSTGPQLALSDGSATSDNWTLRNINGTLYVATSSALTFATTSTSALTISGSGFGTTTVRGLTVNGQATSTSNVGFDISDGCYAVDGVCLSSTGLTSYDAWTHATNFGVTMSATTSPLWAQSAIYASSTSQFDNASTTRVSATYASSTSAFLGSLNVGTLSGFLKATAGAVSTALVNLASDITGTLGIANGGTGTTTAPVSQLIYGGTGGIYQSVATTTVSCAGSDSCTAFTTLGTTPITITGSGLTSYDAWTHATATQSATTSAIGIGTTTPFSQLAVSTSTASNPLTKLFTVASSTGAELLSVLGSGKVSVGAGNSGSFFVSTSTAGCAQFSASGELYSIGSNCGSSSGLTSYDAWTHATNFGVTMSATTSPLWAQSAIYASSTSQFDNASTTRVSATYASSTSAFLGSLNVGTLSGFLKATAGAVSTALVNLASDITGTLGIANGGTGTTTAPVSQLIYGGTGGIYQSVATTTVSCAGSDSCTAFTTLGTTPITITGSGLTSYDAWTHAAATQSATTSAIGIGTTTPFSQLAVSTSTASNPLTKLFTVASSTGAEILSVFGSGNVGIGSSTPWKQFSIGAANVGSFAISTTTGGCAQFSASGELYSIGSNCGSSSGLTSYDAWTHAFATQSATTSAIGIGTTTPFSQLAVSTSTASNPLTKLFTVASSTGAELLSVLGSGKVSVGAGNSGSFFVSTSTAGCAQFSASGELYSIGSNCGSSSGLTSYDAFSHSTNFGVTMSATTSPLWAQSAIYASSTSQFDNASTTRVSATYASSTSAFLGSLNIGTLSGFLKATAGAVSTALVNLASDITGTLGIANGGTGTTTAPVSQLIYGGTGGIYQSVATTTVSCAGSDSCTAFTTLGTTPITITGSGLTSYDAWTHAFATQSATTSAIGIGTTTPFSQLAVSTSTASNPLTKLFTVASSTGAEILSVFGSGNVGIGTSSPLGLFSINPDVGIGSAPAFVVGSSTATKFQITNAGVASTSSFIISSTGGSGTRCLQTGADGTVSATTGACGTLNGYDAWTHATNFGVTMSATTSPLWAQSAIYASSTSQFDNASTTRVSATYASSTSAFLGSLNVGTLSGFLKATAGAVSTALVNLASDITGTLGIANGGTGTTTAPVSQLIYGGTGGIYQSVATTTVSCAGSDSCTAFTTLGTTPITITGSGLTSYDAWTHAAATQSATTSAIGIGTTTPFSQLAVSTSTASNPLTKLFTVASSTGAEILSVFGSGNVGIGTSSPLGLFSINPDVGIGSAPAFVVGSSTATKFQITNAGVASTSSFIISSTGGSGTRCLQTGADGTVSATTGACGTLNGYDAWTHATNFGVTMSATTSPLWAQSAIYASSTSQFDNASTTRVSATYASSTSAFLGSLNVGTLSGFLKATAGAVSTALVNLASDITGTLGIANGGTGTTTAPVSQLIYGGTGGIYQSVATTTVSCAGSDSCTAFTTLGTTPITITGSGLTSYDAWTHAAATQSATTSAIGIGTTTPFSQLAVSTSTASNPLTKLFTVASSTGAELFSVLGNGYVGISTSSPYAKFSIAGSAGGSSAVFAVATTTAAGVTATALNVDSNGNLLIINGTRVGIGTSGPTDPVTTHIATGVSLAGFEKAQAATDDGAYLTFRGGLSGTTARGYFGFTNTGGGGTFFSSNELSDALAIRAEGAFQLGTGGDHIRLSVLSTGNVGIGTTSPFRALSLQGNAGFSGDLSVAGFTATGTSLFSSAVGIGTTTPFSQLAVSTSTASNPLTKLFTVASSTGAELLSVLGSGKVAVGAANTGSFFVSTSTTGCAQFGTSGELYATGSNCTTSSGLTSYDAWTHAFATQSATTSAIGIGTTTPFSQLAVSTSTASNPLTKLFTVASSTGAELLSVLGNGNVGIGTSSPSLPVITQGLVVAAASGQFAGIGIAGGNGYMYDWLVSATTNNIGLYNQQTASYPFYVTSEDRIGIGTTTPWAKFSVNPNALGSGVPEFAVGSTTATHLIIDGAGKVGIGTTSPWGQFSINPNALGSGVPEFAIGSSSATHLVVTGGGKVGIGTSSPLTKIHVTGTDNGLVSGNLTTNTDVVIEGTDGILELVGNSGGNYNAGLAFSEVTAGVLANKWAITRGTSGGTVANKLVFTFGTGSGITTNTTLLTMEPTGSVGIGSTSPFSLLSVSTSTASNPLTKLFTVASSTGAELLSVLGSGKIGIGTSTPYGLFSINPDTGFGSGPAFVVGSSTATKFQITNAGVASTSSFIISNTGGSGTRCLQTGADGTVSATSGACGTFTSYDAFTHPTANQNAATTSAIGIGTTTPFSQLAVSTSTASNPLTKLFTVASSTGAEILSVLGSGRVGYASSSPWAQLSVDSNALGSGVPEFAIGSSTATHFVVTGAGNVGIGTPTPGALLELSQSDATLYTTSGLISPRIRIINTNTTAGNGSALNFTTYDGNSVITSGAAITGIFTSHTTSAVSGALAFQTRDAGTLSEIMRITSTGVVGIGTTTPKYTFNIATSTGPQIGLSDGSLTQNPWTLRSINGGLYFATSSPTTFATSTQDSLYINSSGTVIVRGGTGKITIGTFDPVYTIDGVAYATYASGIAGGVKEETTGVIDIATSTTAADGTTGYIHTVDFDEEPAGSDLWLFANTTHLRKNIDKLVVLLSAEGDSKVWYTVDRAERKVHFLSNKPTRVSYRMTAPRFDSDTWTNYNHDGVTGFTPPADDMNDYFSGESVISFGGGNLLTGTTTIAELTSAPAPENHNAWAGALVDVSNGLKNALSILSDATVQAYHGVQYFTDGIFKRIFAGEVHTDQLCVSDANGETCITKAQLDALIAGAAASQGSPDTPPDNSGGDSGTTPDPDTEAPVILIQGNNPAQITVGDTYADLGATVTDNVDQNLGIHTYMSGQEVQTISIDTSAPGTFEITYKAVDQAGNVGEATRTVVVSAPDNAPTP